MFLLWLHNFLCQCVFNGNLPNWLLKLHELLGVV